jgi:hypothetical protein
VAFNGTSAEGTVTLGLFGKQNSCSDTDGGMVYTIKGTVSGYYNSKQYSYTDYCTSNTVLKEYYCSSKLQYSTSYTCSGTTNACVNGACVQQTTIPTTTVATTSIITTTIPNSCSDTDGGMIYGVKGTVSGYYNSQIYSNTDFCSGSTGVLVEYYCSAGRSFNTAYNCVGNSTTACVDGACI